MNCKDSKELISLYVGHDLDEVDTADVAKHLVTCEKCSELEGEYRETIQAISQFAPPEFGEAVYAGIRSRVIDDISRQTARPRLADRLTVLFGSYARLAAATAAILAIGITALYFVPIFEKTTRLATVEVPVLSDQTPGSNADSDIHDPGGNLNPRGGAVLPDRTGAKPLTGSRHRIAAFPARQTIARVRQSKRPATVETLVAQHGPNSIAGSVPEETLRVEMQTGDPNIRIIWFSNIAPKTNSRN